MRTLTEFRHKGVLLREASGSTAIKQTLLKALKILKLFKTTQIVCDGLAREILLLNGFKANPGSQMTVTNRKTTVGPRPLTLPIPTHVPEEPQVLTLEKLISAEISAYMGRGLDRAQDQAEVVKLIQANRPRRDFGVEPAVREKYHEI